MIINRYPHTYAVDYLREVIDNDIELPLTRAEATRIIRRVSEVIDMDNEEVAIKMADAYLLGGL